MTDSLRRRRAFAAAASLILVQGAALAQSSDVSLYGVLDVGFS